MNKIIPRTISSTLSNPNVDFRIAADQFRRGAKAHHVGILRNPIVGPINGPNFFTAIVKKPGSNIHNFPSGFEEIGQMVADHQYSVSRYADKKYCILTYRNEELRADRDLIGSKAHVHLFPWFIEPLIQGMVFMEDLKKGHFNPGILLTSNKLSKSEYLYSNIETTRVQNAPASRDLGKIVPFKEATNANPAGSLSSEDYLPLGIVPEHSVTLLTANVFHRAPRREELSHSNLGKERSLVGISYLPTKFMELSIS